MGQPSDLTLSFSAGVPLACDGCKQPMMAGLTDAGPVLVHALPVCDAFTRKAMGEAERWARRVLESHSAPDREHHGSQV